MDKVKMLLLYAGVGGCRELWDGCDVTAVEIDSDIASVYQTIYPQDQVVVDDAHRYLWKNYKNFDAVWSSPPCVTHGQYRHRIGVRAKGYDPVMPDMTLYSEIIFLKNYFNGAFVVENTAPYYEPLVAPDLKINRHLFWSNVNIPYREFQSKRIRDMNKISDFPDSEIVASSNIKNKRQVLRNRVDPQIGLHIYEHMTNYLKKGTLS